MNLHWSPAELHFCVQKVRVKQTTDKLGLPLGLSQVSVQRRYSRSKVSGVPWKFYWVRFQTQKVAFLYVCVKGDRHLPHFWRFDRTCGRSSQESRIAQQDSESFTNFYSNKSSAVNALDAANKQPVPYNWQPVSLLQTKL